MDNLKISHDIPLINKISLALISLNDHEFNGFIPIKWPISKIFIKDPDFYQINDEEKIKLQSLHDQFDLLECEFNQILLIYNQNNNFNKQNETNVLIDKFSNKIDDIKTFLFDVISIDKKIEPNLFLRWILLIFGAQALSEHNNKDNIDRNYFQDHLTIQNIWLQSYNYLCQAIDYIYNKRTQYIIIKTNFQVKNIHQIEDQFNHSILMNFSAEEHSKHTDRSGIFCNYLKQNIAIDYLESLDIIKLINILEILKPTYFYDENKILAKNNLSSYSWWNSFKLSKQINTTLLNSLNIINSSETYLKYNIISNNSIEIQDESMSQNSIPDYFEKLANLSQLFPIPNQSCINEKSHLLNKWFKDTNYIKNWEKTIISFKNKINAIILPETEEKINAALLDTENYFNNFLIESTNEQEIDSEAWETRKNLMINELFLKANVVQELIYCSSSKSLLSFAYFERYFILHLSVLATAMSFVDKKIVYSHLQYFIQNTNSYITLLRTAFLERSQNLLNIKSNLNWNEKFYIVNRQTEFDLTEIETVTKKTKLYLHALIQKNYLECKRCYIDYSALVYYKIARLQSLLNSFPEFSNEDILSSYSRSERLARLLMESAFTNLQNHKIIENDNAIEFLIDELAKIDLSFESLPKNDYYKNYLPDENTISFN
ncbi:hypothetical protein [Fluviispira multicolorata]|uniref:Uncharacterized protein n=1 Tax=Fluviispira multicolorata TaxID=2654512 RepID=A0A833JEP2_9BACT|nr:hypothetical protein [Fluviispira multicolorata]KAB8029944.1 hypothetical protein GCL57_10435 [Fluviispira multicolorata]